MSMTFLDSMVETFLLASVIVFGTFCVIISVVFWINPDGRPSWYIFTNLLIHMKHLVLLKVLGDEYVVPLIIICCIVFAIVLLWLMVVQYTVRMCISKCHFEPIYQSFLNILFELHRLDNEIRTIILFMILIDAFFELFALAVLISANVYCSGLSSFPDLHDFDYCKR